MLSIKKDIHKTLIYFLFIHLIIWTLIPTISNNNLPLDTIEALAWGSNLDWGFSKHPPLSAFAVEIFSMLFAHILFLFIWDIFFYHRLAKIKLFKDGEYIYVFPGVK